jgi:integrase/recombinase XerD
MVHLIKRIYKDAGIENASSHSGRRKFATTLIENGADIHCVKTLLGHSSIQTTALYFSTNPKRLANLMTNLSM